MHPKVKENLQKDGQEIFDKFCSSSSSLSIMFPKAPEHTYIDVYPEEERPGWTFADERHRQSDYSAEITVYRALELLEKNLIVLHSFQYSHYQGCPIRNKRKCKKCANRLNIVGECDFVVLGPNYCVILEVKNMSPIEPSSDSRDTQIEALVGTFRKSLTQRTKIESLIESIDPDTTVLHFTAYPSFSKSCKGQFQENADFRLNDHELSTIIFSEDILGQISEFEELTNASPSEQSFFRVVSCLTCCLNRDSDNANSVRDVESTTGLAQDLDKKDFSVWWEGNVTRNVASAQMTQQVRNILLAIWCTEKMSCDPSKCSLGRTIKDIDEKLREGRIILETKKGMRRVQNPGVIRAPDVTRNYVGVHNLTAQQFDVFNSSENLLWINGPAGTGKSVILCSKMIQLAQDDINSKVVLFRAQTDVRMDRNKLYECALDKANMQYELAFDTHQLSRYISESKCNVIIVDYTLGTRADDLSKKLSVLGNTNCHIFFDDVQELIHPSSPVQVSRLIDKLLELSSQGTVCWAACDLVQRWLPSVGSDFSEARDVLYTKLSDKQLTSLKKNLRNSKDISDILFDIRDMSIESRNNRNDVLDTVIVPTQMPGHFIQGPKIIFHILNSSDQLISVLNNELDTLSSNNNVLYNSDIGVVYGGFHAGSLLQDTVERRCSDTDDKIDMCHISGIYSVEWPVVFAIYEVGSHSDDLVTPLYLLMSRARDYCSVILYPGREGDTLDNNRALLHLLEKLKDGVLIFRH